MDSNDLSSAAAPMRVLVFALIAVTHACGPALPPEKPQPEKSPTPMNFGPGWNGLPARSLLSNPVTLNPKALQILRNNPLSDALFDASKHQYMSLQLTDSSARDVMEYIVSCALDRSDQVRYTDPSSRVVYTWAGEMGLCRSWSEEKPSPECLQRVSSCLFARTNRFDLQVPVRFAGLKFQPRAKVAVTAKPHLKEQIAGVSEGAGIASHGWRPGYVGHCVPGKPITLSIREPSRCARTTLRVCSGIHDCEFGDAWFLREAYGACEDAPLTFTCPQRGYYGVMTKSDQPHTVEVVQRRSDAGSYPALEEDVFPHFEGAYYGNLFDQEGLTRFREVILDGGQPRVIGRHLPNADGADEDSIPHRNIYSCYSLENAEEGVAYLSGRICAKPDAKKQCFPNPPQPCRFRDTDENTQRDAVCRQESDGRWSCKGNNGTLYPALAVFLREPCGFTDSGCANLPKVRHD